MVRNKAKPAFLLAVISLIALFSSVFSQAGCPFDKWQKNASAQWWNSNVPVKYALAAKEVKELNKIRNKNSKKIIPLQEELQILKIEFGRYLGQSEIDIREIKSFRKKIFHLEEKILKLQLETRDKIAKILTKKQKRYFYNGGYGWWDKETNWWHSKSQNKSGSRGHKRIDPHGCNL
ncbi:MAG: hypothetical protein GXO74_12855 [Calditrichaeota bacterium]|nr:hypothetical protein [Calditrichota bacterium]